MAMPLPSDRRRSWELTREHGQIRARPGDRGGAVSTRIRNPPGHWRLLSVCLVVLLVVVVFQGFATHTVGVTAERHVIHGYAPLVHARPILSARGGSRLVPVQPPPGRQIALT